MNITYLIGNGFDVHLGLKTKYTDFYPIYIENNKNSKDPIIKQFCNELKGNYENWSDFEAAFPTYVKSEEEVKIILENFTHFFAVYLQSIIWKIINHAYSRSDFQDFIFDGFEHLSFKDEREQVRTLLISKKDELDLTFVNFNYTNTLEMFLDNTTIKSEFCRRYNGILSEMFHIHGALDDFIIIGVDSLLQMFLNESENFYDVEKYCVKKAINNMAKNSVEERFSRTIENSQLIFTYGLSFGESDASRWAILKDWLLYKQPQGIIIVYEYKPIFSGHEPKYLPVFKSLYEEAKVNFLKECLKVPNHEITDDLMSRVMIIDSDEVLNFKLVDEGGADNTSPDERNEVLNP